MQKNWYLVYTKPKCEKKVASILTKRKVEIYNPQNRKLIKQSKKNKFVNQPLFSSYVFVNASEDQVSNIRNVTNVLNFVYWKRKPAIVKDEEIIILKEFINDYQNIRLEKSHVDEEDSAKIIDRSGFTIDGNLLTLKNKLIKINLPSIGYTLIAEVDQSEKIIGRQSTFSKKLSMQ